MSKWLSAWITAEKIKQSSDTINKYKCADGLELSIQASRFHYCEPRTDTGPWTTFEIGYPSETVDELRPYSEDDQNLLGTVYARVPGELIEKIIEKHNVASLKEKDTSFIDFFIALEGDKP